MKISDTLFELFARHGQDAYFGEAVSQLEHGLQAAHLAETQGAPASLVVAALLHDIGHLTHDEGEDAADRGIDTRHEDDGHAWLQPYFGPDVTEPVRLHVAAKRYLCAVDPAYGATLSPASIQSLALQGGPMSTAEVAEFEANPFYREAVRLRHWDDEAKVTDLDVPSLEHYREAIEAVAAANTATA